MKTNLTVEPEILSDASLVELALAGDRDAFGRIVGRYQSPICALAYSACGNVGRSEDLAQEIFIAAWRKLDSLREPEKFKAWLYGIARNLINNTFRQSTRNPLAGAELLDEALEPGASAVGPDDLAITREEETILWHVLSGLPQVFREPMVLFYRQNESIREVAEVLDISEDAVRQRLLRGRTLLNERVSRVVQNGLRRSGPADTFVVAVVASLPLLATSAKAAGVAVAASKGGSAAKAATGGGILGAWFSGGAMLLFSVFGVFGIAGRWIGRRMGRVSQQSVQGRRRICQFWRTLAVGFLALVLPPLLVPNSMIHSHPWLFSAGTWSLSAFYWLVVIALLIWIWQRKRDARQPETWVTGTTRASAKSYNAWIILGMIGPAFLLGSFIIELCFSNSALTTRRVPEAEARKIISERVDAQYKVAQYRDGTRTLLITLPENHRIALATQLADSLMGALTEKNITCPTLIEDQDFHNGGVRGWLVVLSTFIVVAGSVLILRRPGTRMFYQQETATPRAERREKNIVAVCAALGMIVVSLVLVAMTMFHSGRAISTAEARNLILAQKKMSFDVFQFNDGTRELWITPPQSRTYPAFVVPADESILALLGENKTPYKTYVQGRDFGFRNPSRWLSFSCAFTLTSGAVIILWRVIKKNRAPQKSAGRADQGKLFQKMTPIG